MRKNKAFNSAKRQALLQSETNKMVNELLDHVYRLNLQMNDLRNQINHLNSELALSKKVDCIIQQMSESAKAISTN